MAQLKQRIFLYTWKEMPLNLCLRKNSLIKLKIIHIWEQIHKEKMILIVDDNPENIYSLKKVLELNNFDVDTAFSGEEALKKILKNSYVLIILDVQMPGMDGFEVAETISGYSKTKDIPIIFLSAVNTDKRFITKGYASGGID